MTHFSQFNLGLDVWKCIKQNRAERYNLIFAGCFLTKADEVIVVEIGFNRIMHRIQITFEDYVPVVSVP